MTRSDSLLFRALFDSKKRGEMQDALKRGDLTGALRRLKPEAETTRKKPEDLLLPLGMPVLSGDSTIRFMGIERGEAIVMIEYPGGSRRMHVKNGQRVPVNAKGMDEKGKARALFLISKESNDPSGQSVLTVRLEVEGGKP